MADYAISNVPRRVVYTNTGVGPYAFTFEVLANTDIAVYRGTTLLTLTTDYSVTINANGTGSVTLVTAGTGNIAIVGARAIQRTSDYTTGGDLFASTLNVDLDSQTIYAQQVAETAERGLKAPVTDPTDIAMTLPAKTDRASKYLAFDANGNPVATSGTTSTPGTLGNQNSNNVSITGGAISNVIISGGSIAGITDLAVADGGTGASTLSANAVLLGNGTSALQTVSPGASGNVLTSNGTTWTSASANVRGGITTVTLSTASPSATLTSASNQYIRVVLDTTVPYLPSIVMPDMTTLTTGQGYFVISNETGLALAIKDTGGTIREYLPSSGSYTLNITSIATATGVWYFQNSPALLAIYSGQSTLIPRSSYMVAPNDLTKSTSGVMVRLNSTNFAYVYTETSQTATYATLFTVNTTTGAFTVGNKITVVATTYNGTMSWDTDDAGHALVAITVGTTLGTFGLSVSGGTLYASALNTVSVGSYNASVPYVAYLGSNSAYLYGCQFTQETGCCGINYSTYIRGGTVTGTTSVTYTQSASNTNFAVAASSVRTSLTTFIVAGRYVSCTPSANTFTQGARTTASDAESSGANRISGQQGWTYCTGKILQNGSVYDVTNAGTASVLANTSTSYQAKIQLSTNYLTVNGATLNGGYGTTGTTYLVSSSKVILLGGGNLLQTDPTSSTMNISSSGGGAYGGGVPSSMTPSVNLLMSGTYGIGFNSGSSITNLYLQGYPIATSIV